MEPLAPQRAPLRFVDGIPMVLAAPAPAPWPRRSRSAWAPGGAQAAWSDGRRTPSSEASLRSHSQMEAVQPSRSQQQLPSLSSTPDSSRTKEWEDPKKQEREREDGWDADFARGFHGGGSKLKTEFHSFPLTTNMVNKGLRVRLKIDAQKVGRCARSIRGKIVGQDGQPPAYEHLVGMRVQRLGAVPGDVYSRGTLRGIVATMHAQQNGPHAWVDKDPAAEDVALTRETTVEGMKVHLERQPHLGGKIMQLKSEGQWCLVDFPEQAISPSDFVQVEKSADPNWRETFKYLQEFTLSRAPAGPTWVECCHLKATALHGWVPLIQLCPRMDDLGLIENEAYMHYRGQSLVKMAQEHALVDNMGWVPLSELVEDYDEVRYLYRPDYGRALPPSRKAVLRAVPAECCGFKGHRRKSQRELDEEAQVLGGADRFATEMSSKFILYSPATRAWASSFK